MPEIFISYRRQDASGHAGRLHDELARRFGQEQVFMDLSIEPGVDFVEQINDAVGSCHLLIALIGPPVDSHFLSSPPGPLARI